MRTFWKISFRDVEYSLAEWLYMCFDSMPTIAMVSPTFCTKMIVLMLISAQMMLAPVFGAKILFIPANMNSHVLLFSRLAADLTHLGHVTRVLAPSNAHVPQFIPEVESVGNFDYTTYLVDGEEPFMNSGNASAVIMRLAVSQSFWERLTVMGGLMNDLYNHCESDCVRLLDNDHIMKQVRDEGYQFAVMDSFANQCYYAIPYSLGIPYAALFVPTLTWLYRVPRFPSFAPSLAFSYTDRMSFVQRLATFVFDQLMQLQLQNKTTEYVDRLAPERPSINAEQLLQRVQINSVFFLDTLIVF